MKVGIICNKKNKTINRISEELEKLGHECYRLYLKDFIFAVNNDEKLSVYHRKHELSEIDIFFIKWGEENHGIKTILDFIKSINKKIINYNSCTNLKNLCLFENLIKKSVKVINLYHTEGLKAARDVLINLDHPIMILPFEGREKRAVISDDWTESFDVVKSEKVKIFDFLEIPEEIYKTNSYHTAIIVGNKIIFSAEVLTKDKLFWASPLKKYKSSELDSEIINQIYNIKKILNLDICQIDFYISSESEKITVININPFPSIFSIEKKFKSNLAKEIAEFIVSK